MLSLPLAALAAFAVAALAGPLDLGRGHLRQAAVVLPDPGMAAVPIVAVHGAPVLWGKSRH